MLKRLFSIAFAFMLTVAVAACGTSEIEEPVAIVNGVEISRASFNEELDYWARIYQIEAEDEDMELLKEYVLEIMINTALLLEAAEKAGITADSVDEQVESELDYALSLYDSEEEFEQALADDGFTRESYKTMLTESLIIQSLIEAEVDFDSIEISDEDVQELFALLQAQYEGTDIEFEFADVEEFLLSDLREQAEGELISEYIQQLREQSDIEILGY